MQYTKFFSVVKQTLYSGSLSQEQVDGMNHIIDAFHLYGSGRLQHLAYLLATAHHETGARMIPVREGQGRRKSWTDAQARNAVGLLFKKGKIKVNYALPEANGNSYYGRGFVQITWGRNYKKMGDLIGVDLYGNPDEALDFEVAARILIEGCLRALSLKGDFTAYALEDFVNDTKTDYRNARKVVNGLDCADTVAGYAKKFEAALVSAGYAASFPAPAPVAPDPAPAPIPDPRKEDAPPVAPVSPVADAEDYSFDDDTEASPVLRGIQEKLISLGYHDVGKADGRWGTKTRGVVLAFRADNDMPLKPVIDGDFMKQLWLAEPRDIADTRANAKMSDLKNIVPGVKEVSFLKNVMGFFGLGGLAAGGTMSTDDINGVTDKVAALKNLGAYLPDGKTLLIVGVAGVVLYFAVKLIGDKIVNAYRQGKVQ